ncbi:hypothetical protein glysoja_044067 [Glycine soja]|uniref:Secreted protein n=1 Tax=Glycine soja TaxID=3848 RepID=A0A0B2PTF3_GLYSO|nr:hypothetical protein glysoja_044067 [Glycine soja]
MAMSILLTIAAAAIVPHPSNHQLHPYLHPHALILNTATMEHSYQPRSRSRSRNRNHKRLPA